jgi:DNA (cytosine-5)-methyltransferase 1
MKGVQIASLFSGCGGLDLGFHQAGFSIVYSNEYDKTIWPTYKENFPGAEVDARSITEVSPSDFGDVVGFVGGPPCQSWSLAGAMRGEQDPRGKLFWDYLRLVKAKRPVFFVAENVPGILSSAHKETFKRLINQFEDVGYNVHPSLMHAWFYGVPQERSRVFLVGIHKNYNCKFRFPLETHGSQQTITQKNKLKPIQTLHDAIGDLPLAKPALAGNRSNNGALEIPNHEYMNGGFSTIYMSRNRRRAWDQLSFTIQAGGRHAPLHPSCPPMQKVHQDKWIFKPGDEQEYRRLSVRECARIQTFPDSFKLNYDCIADGYKMVGNAVPVKLAKAIATAIMEQLNL